MSWRTGSDSRNGVTEACHFAPMQRSRTVWSGRGSTRLRGASKSFHDSKIRLRSLSLFSFSVRRDCCRPACALRAGYRRVFVQRTALGNILSKPGPPWTVTSAARRSPDNYTPSETRRLAHLARSRTNGPAWPEQDSCGTPATDRYRHCR
jgi:hypothetical protein